MRIIIAGGTGFIGQALTKHFLTNGHEVIIIGRDKAKITSVFANTVIPISWDEFVERQKDFMLEADLVINLAGTNIAQKRWTKENQHEILMSRVQTTKMLAEGCATLAQHSPPLFNASAVGVYGLQKPATSILPKPFDEDDPIDFDHPTDFVSKVARDWEKATHPAKASGVRVVNMRFGLVLGKKGLLAKLRPPFMLGLGGPIGSGNQPFPWVILSDLIAAIDFLIEKPSISGPVNIVSPTCISQKHFAKSFATVLHRPSFLVTPAFLVKSVFGQMGEELLLNGQCAYPKVLLSNNFDFKFTNIDQALDRIFN